MLRFWRKLSIKDVEKGFRAIRKPRNAKRALRLLKKPLRDDQREHARAQEGPGGAKWKPRAKSTVIAARKSKSKRRMRGASRNLLRSIPRRHLVIALRSGQLIATSKVPWAGIHQHGGTAGRGAKIPARPFLWFSQKFFKKAVKIMRREHLREWWRGR